MDSPEILLTDLLETDAWIRALARRLVRDEADAEDVAQEAWVRLLSHRPDKHGPVRQWISTVVRHLSVSRLRSDTSRLSREQAAAKPVDLPSVADLWDQEQLRHRVANAVFSLEEPYRTAILLRYFRGHPPREIAALTGDSSAAIETRLRRGLDRLRADLDRDFGDRATWCAALLPLIDVPSSPPFPQGGAEASVLTGGLLMGLKLKVGIAIVLVAVGAVVAWPRSEAPEKPAAFKERRVAEAKTGTVPPTAEVESRDEETRKVPAATERSSVSAEPAEASAPPSGSLRGRISLIGSGEPCTDAVVRVFAQKPGRNLSRRYLGADADHETKTDQDGTYSLSSVPPGNYRIRIHPLRQPIAQTEKVMIFIREGETTTRDFAVETGVRVRGVVKEKETEKPVAGVKVWHWENPRQTVTTDGKGRFEIIGVEPQMLVTSSFSVDAPNFIRVRTNTRRLPSTNPYLTILLSRGATISGRVIGPDGQGIPGAKVFGDPGKTVSGENGGFVLGRQHAVSNGNTIRVVARGFPRTDHRLEIATGEHKKGVVIRLQQGGSLQVRVANENGDAVAGALVRVVGIREAKTDEDGRAEFSGIVPGSYELRVTGQGNLMSAVRQNVIIRPKALSQLEVVLRRGAELIGVVTDAAHRPVQGARICAISGAARWDERRADTDEDGRFRITGLMPGTLRRVSAAKRGFDTVWIENGVSTGMAGLQIKLNRILMLEGRVVHAGSQAPAKAFWIKILSRKRTQAPSGPRRYLPPKRFFTSPEGRFSTPVYDPGTYTLVAGTKAGERSRVVVAKVDHLRAAEAVLFVLEHGAALHGQVLTENGKPAQSAYILDQTFPTAGLITTERATADEQGEYRFKGLGPGGHLLRAFTPGRPNLEAATLVNLGPGAESRIPLTLQRCGVLKIRVLDGSGRPVARVATLLRRRFGPTELDYDYLFRKHEGDVGSDRFYVTDSSGRTLPRYLPPATYVVKVTPLPKGRFPLRDLRRSPGHLQRTVTIYPDRESCVEIVLRKQ